MYMSPSCILWWRWMHVHAIIMFAEFFIPTQTKHCIWYQRTLKISSYHLMLHHILAGYTTRRWWRRHVRSGYGRSGWSRYASLRWWYWFPSSSCSCQCPCGCGTVVKIYIQRDTQGTCRERDRRVLEVHRAASQPSLGFSSLFLQNTASGNK